jgi:hypothetical protein
MRLNRTLRVEFALLLALMLPLQGFTAMPSCTEGLAAPSLEPQHSAHMHCVRGATATHHHGCGNCCCAAAIAVIPGRWIAPLLGTPEISVAVLGFPPAVTLDRLDRPPRLTLA